ncbi:nucleoside kinase [bacterium]|nr:nucleoside kinase [bacterium]
MQKKINITINGKKITAHAGTTINALLERQPHPGEFPPLGARVNSRIDGLYYKLKSDATIESIDLSQRSGMEIYRRTTVALLCAALAEVEPKARLQVGQSIGDGYFFAVRGVKKVTQSFINKISNALAEIVGHDLPLKPMWVSIEEAINYYKKQKRCDKVTLLEQTRKKEVPLVEIGKYKSHILGPIAPRTGVIKKFKLYKYNHGIVLDFPNTKGKLADQLPEQPKLFATYLETKRWNQIMRVQNIAELNDHCIKGTVDDLVKESEALHEKKIAEIANMITSRKNAKLILIAGPSGSGKTTFSKRLAIQLKLNGVEPISLSIDNYYKNRNKVPRHKDGRYNFEALESLDIKLFNKHVSDLLKGKKVDTPVFSFLSGSRESLQTKSYQLKKEQVLIVEGIHGLNDKLTGSIPHNRKFKIYVSALTQVCIDNHNRIFTSDTRMIRRLIRDRLFRATNAAQTIAQWQSLRAGENKYIFPFQEEADVMFNSSLPYEHALLAPYAQRYLMEIPRDDSSFIEAERLLRFLNRFIPILDKEVPHNSILREFIGDSAFRY